MANDLFAIPPSSTSSTASAQEVAIFTAPEILSRVTSVSQSTRRLSVSQPADALMQNYRLRNGLLTPPGRTSSTVREEVITWCEKYWPQTQGDTKLKRIHQLLQMPEKPLTLNAAELHQALGQIDAWGVGLCQIEYAFTEVQQPAEPHIISWIYQNLCHEGPAEFRLLTLLKREDTPEDLTPAKVRAALLAMSINEAYSRNTITLAFYASRIVPSSEVNRWVNLYWPRNEELKLQEKIHLLRSQPNPPVELDADTLFIALYNLLGINGPGLSSVRRLLDLTKTFNDSDTLNLLNNCWERTSGLVANRLIALLRDPLMQSWRDSNKLYMAMRKLYGGNAPQKKQIRIAFIRVNSNVSDALLKWVTLHWTVSAKNNSQAITDKINALIRQPAMPQPISASMLHSALMLLDENPPAKSYIVKAFRDYNKDNLREDFSAQTEVAASVTLQYLPIYPPNQRILEWLNQPGAQDDIALPESVNAPVAAQMTPEIVQDEQIAQLYQQMIAKCGEDILDRALQLPTHAPRWQTDTRQRKRSATVADLSPAVADKLRRVIATPVKSIKR
ncbi:hypothetical protein ACP3TC_09370 [Winslowiella sp. 2C04]|uniref:hypothetical protein n=1 Tax=Winslowiella sp. 2C04 TaxID=3416179 RepID=UPI003CED111E